LFSGGDRYVQVEITSPLTLGQTVVDEYQVTQHPPNVKLMQKADADGFYNLLIQRLAQL